MSGLLLIMTFCLAPVPQDGETLYKEALGAFTASRDPVTHMVELCRRQPENPWNHHFHGVALLERRELGLAKTAFREADRLDPNNAWHSTLLAKVAFMSLDPSGASQAYRDAARKETRAMEREEWAQASRESNQIQSESDDNLQSLWVSSIVGACALLVLFLWSARRSS